MKKKNNVPLEIFNDQELLNGFEDLGVHSSKDVRIFNSEYSSGDYYPTWGHLFPDSINRGYG